MPRKTRKSSRKQRRRTLRRIPRKGKRGGADMQEVMPPNSSFGEKIGMPLNSDNIVHKIA